MPSSLVVEKLQSAPPAGANVYSPKGNNRRIFYERSPEVLLEGPAGTGKSRAILEKLHLLCLKYPNLRCLIVRKTRESITQSAQVTLEREVMVPANCIPFNHESQEYRYPNGSRIVLAGMDKPSKVLSSQYDVAYYQEATEGLEDEVEVINTRLRNNKLAYQQLILDCNPDAPEHWLNLRCERGVTLRLQTTHEDNPAVTPEYLARLDSLTGWRHKRFRLGLWVASEGMYFEEWDPDLHICAPFEVPSTWTRWAAIDYGFADPFCCLWLARNPADKHNVYVYREAYAKGLRDRQQGEAIVEAGHGERVRWYIADPSTFNQRKEQDKPSIASEYAKAGVRPLAPGVNERIKGWQVVRAALAHDKGKPRLQVMRGRAPNLVRTLPAMVCDPLDSEDLADKIKSVKTEDHAVDALRYALMLEAMPAQQQAKLVEWRFEN